MSKTYKDILMKMVPLSSFWIYVLLLLKFFFVASETCLNSDLLTKAEANQHKKHSDIKTWAVVCLLRASGRSEYTRRNRALATLLAPFADKHNFTILMFSEDKFPNSEVCFDDHVRPVC